MSSECNNITLAIRNAKSKIICVMCKQCLVTANHDVCVLNYVNDMNSRADNQSANVTIHEILLHLGLANLELVLGGFQLEEFLPFVSKSSAVTTADASDKRQQQQDSTSSTSTLATTITADGNFDLYIRSMIQLEPEGSTQEHSIPSAIDPQKTILSTARAKIDVYKRKITLRVGEERIIFTSVKPASSLIKRVYMLSLRERMELDLEARLMGETLVLNRSLDPFLEDYIELNDLNEPFKLRRNQGDDLMPTI
ncbi:hypothetical protein Tco_1402063 [Tanacetum coccineum]